MGALLSFPDISEDATLEVSRLQREALRETFRNSLDLLPMSEAPKEGTTFTAWLTDGRRVTAERFDDDFVACGVNPILTADLFVGWLAGSEERGLGEVPLTDRQERAEYEAEDMLNDRLNGREEA